MVLLALMGSGLARAEGAGVSFGVDGGPGELTLVHTGFRAEVSAGVAVVDVDQLFHNPYDHPIDATYLFPLPPDAAVRSMRIVCGGRRLEGVLLPLDQARARYRQAAADGRKAALLEQERTNLFRQSVANLCPDEDVRVELQYLDPLRIEDGRHELVVPTTVGPLYRPDGTPEPPFTALPAHTVDFEVVIDEGLPVGSVWSDTHGIDVDEDPTGRVTVRNLDDDAIPNKDFELDWTFAGGEPQVGVIAVPPTGGEDGYLGVTIEPEVLEDLAEPRPRELLFVLDESCSMSGAPFEAERELVRLAMSRMRPDDRFDLVRFSSEAVPLFDEPQPATAEAVAAAEAWLDDFLGDGTEMVEGVRASLALPHDPDRLRLVLLLTDGYVGNDAEVLDALAGDLGDARLFSLGVGASVNRRLLDALAETGRGDVRYQLPDTPLSETVDRFYDRIAHPALTDLRLDWGDLDVSEVYPSVLPDLFVGQPLAVVARYRGSVPEATVTLTGSAGRDVYTVHRVVSLDDAAEHEALPVLWARRKIADLERHAADPEPAVTEVALDHHLVSDYTALVATEFARAPCGRATGSVEVPSMLPEGYSAGGTGLGGSGSGSGYGSGSGGGTFGAKGEGGIGTVGGAPIILGSLDRTFIADVVDRHVNQLRYCYQRELQKTPALAGKVS
jgi:Ca-activated chloride channel family protein